MTEARGELAIEEVLFGPPTKKSARLLNRDPLLEALQHFRQRLDDEEMLFPDAKQDPEGIR